MTTHTYLDTIQGIEILFTPSPFLFDLAPDDMYNRDQKHLLHTLLLTARKMIIKCLLADLLFLTDTFYLAV